jgi:hypothetical protein
VTNDAHHRCAGLRHSQARDQPKIRMFRREALMPFDPAALPLSHPTLTYVTEIARRCRVQTGSP